MIRQHLFRALVAATLVVGFSAAYAEPITVDDYVLGPTSPGKWGNPTFGTGATVTWSLMPTSTLTNEAGAGGSISNLGDFMPSGFLNEIQKAFNAWSAVANLTFIQVADDGADYNAATISGDIRIGGHLFDGPSGTLAHGYYPPVNGDSAAGDIHFDTSETWKIGFGGPGFDIFQVLTHEIGHALGLNHSTDPNALMYPYYSEAFSGPQADDIAGMQFIYGAPAGTPPVPVTATLPLPLFIGIFILMMGFVRSHNRKAIAVAHA